MLKLLVVTLVTVAVTDLCSGVVLVPMRDYCENMENNPLDKMPSPDDLRRVTFGYSDEWHLYIKIAGRALMLALKAEVDAFAQKNGCSLPVQKGLLRLNKEVFRYHVRTVFYVLRNFERRVRHPPKTGEQLQHYIDDMTKKCAKALELEKVYSYALKHDMPICTGSCWRDAKELPEEMRLPSPKMTGNGPPVLIFG